MKTRYIDQDQTAALQRDRFHVTGLQNVTLFVAAAVTIAICTMVGVVVTAIMRPGDTSTIATIVGLSTPLTIGFLGAALQGVHKGLNGRLSQLLQVTNDQSEKRGRADVLQGLHRRLGRLEPRSAEWIALSEQIQEETVAHFGKRIDPDKPLGTSRGDV